MPVVVTPTYSLLQGRRPFGAYEALRAALSYWKPGLQYDYAYRVGRSDGKIYLAGLQEDAIAFPTGLLDRALQALQPWAPDLVDQSGPTPTASAVTRLSNGTTLYPEQIRALESIVEHRRGLLALATNFGKTELIAATCASYARLRCLVLVNRQGLLRQTARRLQVLLGERVGRWGDGVRDLQQRVTVAMIQSARSGAGRYATFLAQQGVLVVDEVHTVTNVETWAPVLGQCPAHIRIGLSGSVKDAQHKMLMEAFLGPVLMTMTDGELVALGRSAVPIILMPTTGGATITETPLGGGAAWDSEGAMLMEYPEIYEEGIVHNTARNTILVETAATAAATLNARVVILFYRLPHGELLARGLRQRGVRVALINGSSPEDLVERAQCQLVDRTIQVIVASTVWNTGINLPEIDWLVNAAGWRSPLATGQKFGRGIRKKLEGPNQVVVLDPFDTSYDLLQRQARARARTYQGKGFPVHRGPWDQVLRQVPGWRS